MSRATFIHSLIEGHRPRTRNAGARDIIRATAIKHGLTYDDLTGKKRVAHIVRARHEAVLRLHETSRYTLSQIGSAIGGRDHSTILNSIKRGRELRGD